MNSKIVNSLSPEQMLIYASTTSSMNTKSLTDAGDETLGFSDFKQEIITDGIKRGNSS